MRPEKKNAQNAPAGIGRGVLREREAHPPGAHGRQGRAAGEAEQRIPPKVNKI